MGKRIFLIVLDSFGIGAMLDAENFGDFGVNTLASCAQSPFFSMPNMARLGLFHIDGADCVQTDAVPEAVYGRMAELSKGKDTTIGHWEIAGIRSDQPLPTYSEGFPKDVLDEFSRLTGRGVLCNLPYSGTKVIADYGEEHVKTGKLIVYTSADSVFQIAAHEDIVPVETLYEYCRAARELLRGVHGVGRVIARPFVGTPGNYTRTSNRHDFSLEPPAETMLDALKSAGKDVLAVGKIKDIFTGRGITDYVYTTGNEDGIEKLLAWMERDFDGLCFVNLVDFDMLYGHRRDIDGYAKALAFFDGKLPAIMEKLREDDLLMITADHGCDPGYDRTTDHTREYIPFLLYGKRVKPADLGTRNTFADIGATVLKYFDVLQNITGTPIDWQTR